MSANSADLQSLVLSLRQDYLKSLNEKIMWIENNCQAIAKDQSMTTLLAMIDQFHKWKGTGATYGMPELSQIAAQYEGQLKSCLNQKQDFPKPILMGAVQALRQIHSSYSK